MDEHTTPDSQHPAGEGYSPPEAPLEGVQPPAEAPPQPTPVPPPAPQPAPQPQPQPAPAPQPAAPPPVVEAPRERDRGRRTLGIVLIVLGVVFLVNQFIAWDIFWPVILIVIGLIVLFRR